MLTLLAVMGVAAPIVFTAYRILGRVRGFAADREHLRLLREFVDSFSRELGVGAPTLTAAGHALDALAEAQSGKRVGSDDLYEHLNLEVRRVMLGAVPGCSMMADRSAPDDERAGSDSARRGDTELVQMLAVWELAHRYGIALGRLMAQMRCDLDARSAHGEHTSSALAGARLTEAILLLLPLGSLGIGQSMGVDPVGFLCGNMLGVLLLVVGVLLGCLGALWTESLTVAVLGGVGRRAGPSLLDAARILDLFAESLVAGLPLATAWNAAVMCGRGEDQQGYANEKDRPRWRLCRSKNQQDLLRQVAGLLALGAGTAAWRPLNGDPHFGPIARLAESGARNGARLAEGVQSHANYLRQKATDLSLARAEQVLVVVAAPLTLCFLPAFILVGLIPVVVGFAGI